MQTFSSKRSRLNWNDADNIVQTVNFQLKQTLKFKLETQTFKQTLRFKLYRCLNLKVNDSNFISSHPITLLTIIAVERYDVA